MKTLLNAVAAVLAKIPAPAPAADSELRYADAVN